MGRVLVIGAGGVSTVAVKKIAMNADVFTDIMVASRTKSKCDKIAANIKNVKVQTAQVDADNVQELVALFNAFKPDLVVNLALPYQDLHIMDACLEYGVSYLDTANYEPLDEAKYQYSWQWAYKDQTSRKPVLPLSWDVVSIRGLPAYIQPMRQSIISTRYTIWIS